MATDKDRKVWSDRPEFFIKTLWGLRNNLFTNINHKLLKQKKKKISFTRMKKSPDISRITFGTVMYYSVDNREYKN